MKIKIEFDSLEEIRAIISQGLTVKPEEVLKSFETATMALEVYQTSAKAPVAEPAEAPEKKPAKAKKDTPEAKTPEEAMESPTEGKTPTEEDRVSVRKALAKLNKLTGKNVAREILEDMGYDKLTEVPLERLAELMEKAKEAYHAE